MRLAPRVLYGRGLNIAAQLAPHRRPFPQFAPLEEMQGVALKRIGCGFLQSYYLLENGGFVKAGYFMDSLTSVRVLNLHRLAPPLVPLLQRLPLGRTLSFRGGDERPTLFSREVGAPFEEVVFGGSRVFAVTAEKQVYAMGENYFGQLATHSTANSESSFVRVPEVNKERVVGIGCGFQHTLLLTNADNLYGCGKASDYQVQPVKYAERGELAEKLEHPEAMLKGERVRKATGGLKFSLVWADRNRLLAVGSNRFGQCGQNNLRVPEVKQLTPVGFQWERGEEVLDIASGFCHSLVLTNKYVYFFGSIEQGQNPFAAFKENICTPTILPIRDPVKIFAGFDRSAVINAHGQAFLFGGRDYSGCGGESGRLEELEGLSQKSEIGLGFAHTLVYP